MSPAVEERFGPHRGGHGPATLDPPPPRPHPPRGGGGPGGGEGCQARLRVLPRDFVGRPTPLYLAERLSELADRRVYLKREDLAHTGAHKINKAVAQVLVA